MNIITYFGQCSREGTPTDNPIIEALNGWMKEELYLDFGLATYFAVGAFTKLYAMRSLFRAYKQNRLTRKMPRSSF